MKPLSDNDVIKNLEKLGESFQPLQGQKENLYNGIFLSNKRSEKSRINTWIPIIVSLVLLLTIVAGAYAVITNSFSLGTGKDVTASWNHVILDQESSNDLSGFYLYFDGQSLIIQDDTAGIGPSVFDMSEEEVEDAVKEYTAKRESLTLRAGEFPKYRVKKNKDFYEITVPGKEGFTYTLEKIAPRKFMGEDGIQYSTSTYID